MADSRDVDAEVLPMFELDHPYIVDQSFSKDDFYVIPPTGRPNNTTLTYNIDHSPGRMIDLQHSFIHMKVNLGTVNGTALTPNLLLSLANNALMHMFTIVQLKINGTTVEQQVQAPGVFNTMQNLLWYSKQFSTSAAAPTNMCWSLDNHTCYTFNTGAGLDTNNAGTPNVPLTDATAIALSSGMDNSVNCIPFSGQFSSNANYDISYITNIVTNTKYSMGFDKRHQLLFNGLATGNNNAAQLAGTSKNCSVTFRLPLSHSHLSRLARRLSWVLKLQLFLTVLQMNGIKLLN